MNRESENQEFEVLERGTEPGSRMGNLHKDGCCGGRA